MGKDAGGLKKRMIYMEKGKPDLRNRERNMGSLRKNVEDEKTVEWYIEARTEAVY